MILTSAIAVLAEERGSQQTSAPAVSTRAEVDGLLAQVRSKMAAGRLTDADAILRRAESAEVRYPVLHFGDTPAKVRHELEALSRKQGIEIGGLPLRNPLAALLPKTKPATVDPFAASGKLATQLAPAPAPQPRSPINLALPSPLGTPSDTKLSPRESSDRALLAARQALAVGDAVRARRLLENARLQRVTYLPTEESPERIAQALAEIEQLFSNEDNSPSWRQGYAKFLVAQASALVEWGDFETAERAAFEAVALKAELGPNDTTPAEVLGQIEKLRAEAAPYPMARSIPIPRMIPDANVQPAWAALVPDAVPVDLTLPAANTSQPLSPRLAQANSQPSPLPVPTELLPESNDPYALLEQGERALRAGDRNRALRQFRLAYQQRDQLDLASQQQLQGHLQMLSTSREGTNRGGANRAGTNPRPRGSSMLDSATNGQTVVARQLSSEIGRRQSEASQLRTSDPQAALDLLQEASALVAKSELDESMKSQLSRRVELSIAEVEQYISDHSAELELDEANRAVLDDIERQRMVKGQVRDKIAELVDQYNTLRDEQRYAEMEVVAKRLYDMAPDEPVAKLTWANAKFIRRTMLNREIADMSEAGVDGIFRGIREDAAEGLVHGDSPISYGSWADLVNGRRGSSDSNSRMSPRELEIQRKLRTPVLPRYDDMPLSLVIEGLSNLTGVNIHLDPRGLGQEGVRSDTPVTLNLGQEISLESVLNLILEPLHLTYMIKDEVLKVTSEQIRDGDVITKTYNVADLVIPIPNFVPNTNMGLQGLINDAYETIAGSRQNGVGMPGPVSVVAGNQNGSQLEGNTFAQQVGTPNSGGSTSPLAGGPGGLGGAASADFDSLIDLIVSTVEFDSWMENGTGEGEIRPFPTNLSLVISQTQSIHEKVADLLEQLRRLQDLQVTIEVRFIRLTDSFFERIGIDFDFNIQGADGNFLTATADSLTNSGSSATVGLRSDGTTGDGLTGLVGLPNFTVDLDIPFRQGSFGLTRPQFGTPQDIGQFGFAILSDIEAFFLINASQGDSRANILNAPKVTLFNGQQAIIVDTSFTPFVISVIPVVGEFAAAQQPVIVVLSEGTTMTVQAVVSDDRRYVRLTIVPFFSQIGEVTTFTFEGSETTSASSDTTDQDDDGNDETNNASNNVTRSGTTVQLPTFEVISVATTVSVPDGGTVLLGGIKRLREGRNEFGVPLLGKVPYIDRLFRNVGIGRETDSLMMMVTPHIIIQEEEEERLGIVPE
ncbi:MAG: general secretion pathway protein GspD [Planctomycetes bacterium]|nr:general secretion pathway protein GspD [Planctomycetota bacterium]